MSQAILPIMRPGGRIVNVSSVSGGLHKFGETLQSRFRDPNITLDNVELLAQEYEVIKICKTFYDSSEENYYQCCSRLLIASTSLSASKNNHSTKFTHADILPSAREKVVREVVLLITNYYNLC